MAERKPITVPDFTGKKRKKEPLAVVTAYDYSTACLAERAGVDAILVGDSLGMVVYGEETTLTVTVDDIIRHTRAVKNAHPKALVIADLPFLSYQLSEADTLLNAGRLLREGGASAVKLEGGAHLAPTISRLVQAGIPVMGHLGFTPQSVHAMGFKVQARDPEQARRLLDDARAIEAAGVFGVVLETIPAELARVVTEALQIPTIGIGAGPHCDGQVQVFHDLLGLYDRFMPRHAKRYAEVGEQIAAALSEYVAEVRSGAFPTEAQTVHEPRLEENDTWKS